MPWPPAFHRGPSAPAGCRCCEMVTLIGDTDCDAGSDFRTALEAYGGSTFSYTLTAAEDGCEISSGCQVCGSCGFWGTESACDEILQYFHPGALRPADGGSCFELHANPTMDDTTFTFDTTGLSGLALWTQHVPTEFCPPSSSCKLKDANGLDVDAVAELGSDGHDHGRRLQSSSGVRVGSSGVWVASEYTSASGYSCEDAGKVTIRSAAECQAAAAALSYSFGASGTSDPLGYSYSWQGTMTLSVRPPACHIASGGISYNTNLASIVGVEGRAVHGKLTPTALARC